METYQGQLVCGMCGNEINSDRGCLQKEGADTVIEISEQLNDGLAARIRTMTFPILIHKACRRNYARPSTVNAKKRKLDHGVSTTEGDSATSRSKTKKYNPYTD